MVGNHVLYVPHSGRQMILPTTQAWRNRFVALSLPCLRDCVICKITLRTFSRISKRDLQNTQTAPLAAVCTPTIRLDHKTTNKKNCVVMCVKTVCVYFSLILFLSPSVSAPNRILLCLSSMCQNPVALFCGNVPPESAKRECLRLSVPLTARSAPLSGPRPSQMMTCGGMQLTTHVSLLEGL